MNPDKTTVWRAPVKINLFLHINGRISEGRYRGYHEVQTFFQRVDYGDELTFERTDAPDIFVQWREGVESIALKPANTHDDLIYRAAVMLQDAASAKGHPRPGAQITLTKNTPVGGGLGGGSSAAATALMALNQLWGIGLSLAELLPLARNLGADVPFFLYETNAWGEGIGDHITPYPSPVAGKWVVIVVPKTHRITAQGFAHPQLVRNEARSEPARLIEHWQQSAYNAFEAIALQENPAIATCHRALGQVTGFARMTGSGACLFSPMASQTQAEQAARLLIQNFPAMRQAIQRVIIAQALPDQPVTAHGV